MVLPRVRVSAELIETLLPAHRVMLPSVVVMAVLAAVAALAVRATIPPMPVHARADVLETGEPLAPTEDVESLPDAPAEVGEFDVRAIRQHGGHTDIAQMTLLCGHHHREHQRSGWHCTITTGVPHWVPPCWIDPEQKPQRNTVHHVDRLLADRPELEAITQ